MKRLLLAFAVFGFVLSVVPRTTADEVGVDYFYDNLSGGSWIDVEGYGYCWQPDVALNDQSWRPYTDGYWAYTDDGWTWISYEDFGWATYHYGRWARLSDYGWVWVPGADLEWGPAWVSWRTGGDYIGWAPLPPRGTDIVYESQPIGPRVDVEFDIGPEYYNFCDVRYIGEPVLRQRIVDYHQNVTYINQTVNVTNITVQNNTVYNYGPDINYINQHSTRPIQRLRLERQQNVDLSTAARSGAVTKVQGNTLIVAAPMKLAKRDRQVAPRQVKTKVAQAKIDKGWAGTDPTTQNEIKQKMKTEDHNKIPPPTGAGARVTTQPGAAGPAGAGAAAQTQANVSASPAAPGGAANGLGAGKGKHGTRGEALQGQAGAAASVSPGTSASAAGIDSRRKGRRGEQSGANPPTAGSSVAPDTLASPIGKRGRQFESRNVGPSPSGSAVEGENFGGRRGKHQRGQFEGGNVGPSPTASALEGENPRGQLGKHHGGQFEGGNVGPSPSATVGENLSGPGKRNRRLEEATTGTAPGIQSDNANAPGGKRHRGEQVPTSPSGESNAEPLGGGNPDATRGGKHRAETVNAPAGGAASPGPPTGAEKHEGKQTRQTPSPSPAP
jgi:hypothetical protein